MSAKTAVTKVDWGRIISTLGLRGETSKALHAFRKRSEDAKIKVAKLEASGSEIDFSHYRGLLKNQKVLNEIEAAVKSFKPATYDPSKHIKTIEAFEAKALENAEATQSKVKEELGSLKETLDNIQSARAFEDLVVEDITKAAPEVDEKVAEMVKKGKWHVPGYEDKFGSQVIM